jgi:hypothetical protein
MLLDQTTPQTIINGSPLFNAGLKVNTGFLVYGNVGAFPTGLGTYIGSYVSPSYGARITAYDGVAYQNLSIGSMPSPSLFSLKLTADGNAKFGYNVGIGDDAHATAKLNVIGTDFPLLRVVRTTSATNTFGSSILSIAKSTGDMTDGFGGGTVYGVSDTGVNDTYLASVGAVRDGADTTGRLVFNTYSLGASTEKMTILGNGNVGIDTTNPLSILNIQQTNLTATTYATYRPSSLMLSNPTAAASGVQQLSPPLVLAGKGWGTTASTSQLTEWFIYNLPVQGTTPTSNLKFSFSINSGALSDKFTLTSAGDLTISGGFQATTGTFTSTLSSSLASLITTPTTGVLCTCATAALVGTPVRISPSSVWRGTAWNTTPTAASKVNSMQQYLLPVSGAVTSANLIWANGTINGVANTTELMRLSSSGQLGVNVSNFLSVGNIINAGGTNTGTIQTNAQNFSNGTSASADHVATADTGNDTTNYIDMGINSSTYNDANYTIGGALSSYLYCNGGDLAIGTQTAAKVIKLHTGGTLAANLRLTVSDDTSVFTNALSASNLSGTNTGDETNSTIKTKLGAANTTTDGYLTSSDWNTFNSKLSSLSGAVLTSQVTPQTIGATGSRLAKLWVTDITCTNAIAGSVTGASTSCSGNSATASKSTNLIGGNSTTLLGSIPYQSGTDTTTLLAPNTTTTKKFLRMTGTGTNGATPAWDTISATDIADASSYFQSLNSNLTTISGYSSVQDIGISSTPQFAGLKINTATLDDSSILDLASTTKGSRPFPSMTGIQRLAISNPVSGLMVYDTTDKIVYYYNGTSWGALGSGNLDATDKALANRTIDGTTNLINTLYELYTPSGSNLAFKTKLIIYNGNSSYTAKVRVAYTTTFTGNKDYLLYDLSIGAMSNSVGVEIPIIANGAIITVLSDITGVSFTLVGDEGTQSSGANREGALDVDGTINLINSDIDLASFTVENECDVLVCNRNAAYTANYIIKLYDGTNTYTLERGTVLPNQSSIFAYDLNVANGYKIKVQSDTTNVSFSCFSRGITGSNIGLDIPADIALKRQNESGLFCLSANMNSVANDTKITIDEVKNNNGVSFDSVNNRWLLKANRTYKLKAMVSGQNTGRALDGMFYNETASAYIGLCSFNLPIDGTTYSETSQPEVISFITPEVDTYVHLRKLFSSTTPCHIKGDSSTGLTYVEIQEISNMVDYVKNPYQVDYYQTDLTVTGTNWTTIRAKGLVYKTVDGVWRLKFNLEGLTNPNGSYWNIYIAGVVFKDLSAAGRFQACTAVWAYSYDTPNCIALTNSNNLQIRHVASIISTTVFFALSGDIELESKPSWI